MKVVKQMLFLSSVHFEIFSSLLPSPISPLRFSYWVVSNINLLFLLKRLFSQMPFYLREGELFKRGKMSDKFLLCCWQLLNVLAFFFFFFASFSFMSIPKRPSLSFMEWVHNSDIGQLHWIVKEDGGLSASWAPLDVFQGIIFIAPLEMKAGPLVIYHVMPTQWLTGCVRFPCLLQFSIWLTAQE